VAAETDRAAAMVPAMVAAMVPETAAREVVQDPAADCRLEAGQEVSLARVAGVDITPEKYQLLGASVRGRRLPLVLAETVLQSLGVQILDKAQVEREADRQLAHPVEALARGISSEGKAAEAGLPWPPMRADFGSTRATRHRRPAEVEPALLQRWDRAWD